MEKEIIKMFCHRKYFAALLLIVLFLVSTLPDTAIASTPLDTHVVFLPTEIENSFPESLRFSTRVSAEETIQSAKFYFRMLNSSTTTQIPLEVEPSNEADLTYTWDTSDSIAVPSTPVYYSWEVVLSSREVLQSEEELIYYDDIRFDWQIREKNKLFVWWHDRPDSLGDQVFDIAVQSMEQQAELFGVELDFPIKLIIYNTNEEFAEWHNTPTDMIGGQAFSSMGITTQIVRDNAWQRAWLLDVIPHEISHLYFFQVTYHPLSTPPSWLNEGVAQFNELSDNSASLEDTRNAIQDGNYIPLWGLSGSFDDGNKQKFYQSYDQSLSAVTYMVETYGKEGMSQLLAAYKSGNNTDGAFPLALGVTVEEFEQDWLTWIGAPEGTYISPPDLTVPSMSEYLTQTVQKASVTETPEPVIPTQLSTSTSVPQTEPTAIQNSAKPMISILIMIILLCGLGVLAILFITGMIFIYRRRANEN